MDVSQVSGCGCVYQCKCRNNNKYISLAGTVFDSDVTSFDYEVSSALTWTPTPPHPTVSPSVTQIRIQPSVVAAGCFDTSQLQGLCPCHPITHYQPPACPMTPRHSPFLSLNGSSSLHLCLHLAPSTPLLHDYSEVCALVKLAVNGRVMHKLLTMAELWHPANGWRTCTGQDV